MKKLLQKLFKKKAQRNIRVKNLVYNMVEHRQSPPAIEIDLMYRKERTAR